MTDSLLIWGGGLLLAAAATIPVILRVKRKERRTREAEIEALRHSLHQPATLHPVVDTDRCIGTGACVSVCPEGDVLGFRHGRGFPVSPARCVGHGLCERSCPMEAIRLVFGTETRGVELPRVKENYETNVPGLYVVGELGGMGLIRNAFEQGRQCVEAIAKLPRQGRDGELDLLIVGCGPAGLSASLTARSRGLRFLVVEKENVGGTVRHYPRKKLVMTSPLEIPGFGRLDVREILKEDLVEIWERAVDDTGLEVRTGVTVQAVDRTGEGFEVVTDHERHRARRVVLAIGRRGVPRRLGVPGEDTSKVAYALREPEAFRGDRILVVGGGDSAVETALALAEQPGNRVAVSYRRDRFSRLKPANLGRVEAAVGKGEVEVLWETEVVSIEPGSVRLIGAGGEEREIPNDRVFVCIGGVLPTAFLRGCGVEIDTKFGKP